MSRRKRKKPGTLAHWSDTQKIELVTTWLATGNLALAAATLGIPEVTARRWKASPWFKQMVEDIRMEENVHLDGKLSKVVNKSVEALLDRVEHGDFQYDQKNCVFVRKPISAKDASTITRDMIDRRELLQGKKERSTNEGNVNDKLVMLAQQFAKFASAKTIEHEPLVITNEATN